MGIFTPGRHCNGCICINVLEQISEENTVHRHEDSTGLQLRYFAPASHQQVLHKMLLAPSVLTYDASCNPASYMFHSMGPFRGSYTAFTCTACSHNENLLEEQAIVRQLLSTSLSKCSCIQCSGTQFTRSSSKARPPCSQGGCTSGKGRYIAGVRATTQMECRLLRIRADQACRHTSLNAFRSQADIHQCMREQDGRHTALTSSLAGRDVVLYKSDPAAHLCVVTQSSLALLAADATATARIIKMRSPVLLTCMTAYNRPMQNRCHGLPCTLGFV